MKCIVLLLAICLTACGRSSGDAETSYEKPRTSVTLTHVTPGRIRSEIVLSGTTVYQNKTIVTAPIPSFISEVNVQPGMKVEAGQLLYKLESKEHRALSGELQENRLGMVAVRAAASGIVTSVMQQTGSFVAEGTALCTLADLNSLVFELNVPYEQSRYIIPGKTCTIVLPDATVLKAVIRTPLATMNTASQVQQVVAHARSSFLPEGLTVKVLVDTGHTGNEIRLLPKAAVQSDEKLTGYWVMKLADDSTAVRIPVIIGNSSADSIEIVSPLFSASDRIVLSGSYALEDSARVVILK